MMKAKSVRVQFSFRNMAGVPKRLLPRIKDEQLSGLVHRQTSQPTGTQIIKPRLNNITLEALHEDLMSAGYVLSNAYWQMRLERNKDNGMYPTVTFLYALQEDMPEAYEQEAQWAEAITEMTLQVLWRVRAYNNPCKEDRSGATFALSINLEHRNPMFEPSGKPRVDRMKDEYGRPFGKAVKIEPEFYLKLDKNWMPELEKLGVEQATY